MIRERKGRARDRTGPERRIFQIRELLLEQLLLTFPFKKKICDGLFSIVAWRLFCRNETDAEARGVKIGREILFAGCHIYFYMYICTSVVMIQDFELENLSIGS